MQVPYGWPPHPEDGFCACCRRPRLCATLHAAADDPVIFTICAECWIALQQPLADRVRIKERQARARAHMPPPYDDRGRVFDERKKGPPNA